MRFTQDSSSAANLIRAYGAGELKINDAVFRDPVIVERIGDRRRARRSPASRRSRAAHAAPISRSNPSWCCSAPARVSNFRPPEFGAQFLRAGIGFEVMDTGAACRTFNVLVAEQRRVAALLLV